MTAIPHDLRELDLEPTPEPHILAKYLMYAIASKIDGYLDQDPTSFSPLLEHNFYLPEANLVIVGTSCSRPLVTREAMLVTEAVGANLLIVRSSDTPGRASFDVRLSGGDCIFVAYRLWIPRPTGTGYLVPSVGDAPCLRLEQTGLEVEMTPPYETWAERYIGLEHGAEYLSVATQGWF